MPFPVLSDFGVSKVDDKDKKFLPACVGCKHYATVEDQDGWENPVYMVPICMRPTGRNKSPRLADDGGIEDWPYVEKCSFRKVENGWQNI